MMTLGELLSQDEVWLTANGYISIDDMSKPYRFKAAAWLLRRANSFFDVDKSEDMTDENQVYGTAYTKMTSTALFLRLMSESDFDFSREHKPEFDGMDARDVFTVIFENAVRHRELRLAGLADE